VGIATPYRLLAAAGERATTHRDQRDQRDQRNPWNQRNQRNQLMAGDESDARLAELEHYLAQHPDTASIDAIFIDLCGIVRGKRYPRADAEKLFARGIEIPYTVYLLDVTGLSSDPCGRGFSDGDPDGVAVPVPETLAPVPWAHGEIAQTLMTMRDDDGSPCSVEPRNVASRVLERFSGLGLYPVMAYELEFYLLDPERDAHGRPQPPVSPATGRRERTTQVYGIAEIGGFAAFFEELEHACAAQGIPASVATSEFAPGQYEVNLRHVASAIRAADHCALFRHAVQQVARRHGMDATFMSKPFPDQTGSGMHVHVSLLDGDGRNVLDDGSASGSEMLRHAVAGLQALQAGAMAVYAPNVNAFRRFVPDQFVPVTRDWGYNNRSMAYRIPAGASENRRIEHRIAGAEANPYLVLAVLLAGLHHGIANRLDPGPPAEGNAGAEIDPDIPFAWSEALARMEGSRLLREYLGDEYVALYCATKRNEMRRLAERITPLEYDWYL